MRKLKDLLFASPGIIWFVTCLYFGAVVLKKTSEVAPRTLIPLFPFYMVAWVVVLFLGQYALYGIAKLLILVIRRKQALSPIMPRREG